MTRILLVIMDGADKDTALSECGWLEGPVAPTQLRRATVSLTHYFMPNWKGFKGVFGIVIVFSSV